MPLLSRLQLELELELGFGRQWLPDWQQLQLLAWRQVDFWSGLIALVRLVLADLGCLLLFEWKLPGLFVLQRGRLVSLMRYWCLKTRPALDAVLILHLVHLQLKLKL